MSFLLDTNICSAHIRDERRLFSRFQQHAGQLYTSRLVLAELYVWAHLRNTQSRMEAIGRFLDDVTVFEFDDDCAREFGRLRAALRPTGINVPTLDLLIASSAIARGHVLVTSNQRDFQSVPGLMAEDWLA